MSVKMSEYSPSTPISDSPVPLLGTGSPALGSPTPSAGAASITSHQHQQIPPSYYHHSYQHGTASTPTTSGAYFPHFGSISSGSSAGTSTGSGSGPSKSSSKHQSSLSMDRAAFLMIRIKRIFQKKKRKGHTPGDGKEESKPKKQKPPMLRARTLPAIIPPAFNIVQAQMLNRTANDYELTETLGTGGRSPELLLAKDGSSSNGVSPRHSVSSNSSNGSTAASKDAKTDKKTSFAKLTRLLSSNNTGHKLMTNSSGSFWTMKSSNNQNVLCQDGLSDASCFFWHNKHSANKMKRTGSVDSLLSQVNGGGSDGAGTTGDSTMVESPPGGGSGAGGAPNYGYPYEQSQMQQYNYAYSPYQKHQLTAKYSNASTKTYKSGSPALASKSSTYYLGSMLNSGFDMSGYSAISTSQHSFYGNRTTKIPGKRQMSIDINAVAVDGLKKSDRKKFEKLSKFNFDQQALFSAVENEHFERTQMIIETTDVDINSTNSDGFTPLDISLMLLNMPLIKYLQSCGAREGDAFTNRLNRELHLSSLLSEAERCVHDLSMCSRQSSNGSSSLSSALLKEKERQLVFWERRLRLLQRLKKGLELLEPPPPPLSVHVEVVGASSLLVHYFPPIRLQDKKNIITKYKIEWSDNSFESIAGAVEITNLAARHEFIIDGLEPERCYNVRIASGNCKGFSDYCYPLMNQSTPSTWRSIDSKSSNFAASSDRMVEIDNLFRQIINSRQQVIESELKRLSIDTDTAPALAQQQKRVRKSIKNFFGTANKFQKVMKRGVYFACLIYHEERVLVTNEEVLPIIEIDDIYPSSLQNDFYWLLKISCTWEDTKMFRKDMEKSQSSSVAHFRTRILMAIEQMQSSLGLQDLGKLFYKPLRDSEGTVVFCAIKCLSDPKLISCLSLRWLPLAKLQKRLAQQQQALLAQQQLLMSKEVFSERVSDSGISVGGWDSSPRLIGDILLGTLDEMIEFHKACNNQLPRGLYIGYVKLRSSVDMMSVMVAKSHPNILPYAKIRDNPHISKQEWAALKLCLRPGTVEKASSGSSSSLIHSNLSASASQLYLATLQQQKEVVESTKESAAKDVTGQNGGGQFGNYLTASSPTPTSPAQNQSSASPGTGGASATSGSSHLTQFFQLACSNMNANNGMPSRCSSSASTATKPELVDKSATQTSPPTTTTSQHRNLTFAEKLSFQQLLKFLQMLTQTAGHFLQSIGVTDGDHCDSHRLYSLEVIELSPDVAFILLLPPVDEVCSIFNHNHDSLQVPNLIYLPLKIFELIHMDTYQQNFTGRYSRISAMLESDIMVAQQAQREAFSSSEVTIAKARVNQLQEFQTQLDEHCRSMRWIMDVVAFARDRQLTAGIPLFDVQYTLGCVDKELLEEDNDDRLFHIPAISLSTPSEYGPKINIQSECNSTPSSPPAMAPPPSALGRRKSRDDSYLEEHHRIQNHFNSVHHHRFHHQYGCSHQNSLHFHSDSLESACNDLDQLVQLGTGAAGSGSIKSDLHQIDTLDGGGQSSGGSSGPHEDQPSLDNPCSKSSVSLLDSVQFMSTDQRGSLTVDKSALEDMRRCVSASRLSGNGCSSNDSPNFCCFQTPPGNHTTTCRESSRHVRAESCSNSNYFFGGDMDMYDNEVISQRSGKPDVISPPEMSLLRKSSEMLHLSNQSIDSLSDISITCPGGGTSTNTVGDMTTTSNYGGSQLSVNSASHVPVLPYDQDVSSSLTNMSSMYSSTSAPPSRMMVEFTENYRPLSRVLMFPSDAIEQDLILEEEEDELLAEMNEPVPDSKDSLIESKQLIPHREIPKLKIWSNPSEELIVESPEEEIEFADHASEDTTNRQEESENSFSDNFVMSPPSSSLLSSFGVLSEAMESPTSPNSPTTILSCDNSLPVSCSEVDTICELTTTIHKPSSSPSIVLLASSPTPSTSIVVSTICPVIIPPAPLSPTKSDTHSVSSTCSGGTSAGGGGGPVSAHSCSFFNDNFGDILPDSSSHELICSNVSAKSELGAHPKSQPPPSAARHPLREKVISENNFNSKRKVSTNNNNNNNNYKQPYVKAHSRKTIEMVKIVYKPKKSNSTTTTTTNHHQAFEFSLRKLERLSRNEKEKRRKKENSKKKRMRNSCCPECCSCTNPSSSTVTTESSCTESDFTEPEEELIHDDEQGTATTSDPEDYHNHHHNHYPISATNNHSSLKYPLDDRAMHRRRTNTLQHQYLLQEDSVRRNRRKSSGAPSSTHSLSWSSRRMITVHIAYQCRVVPFGTQIKLKVTRHTVVSEIVETIVRYLKTIERSGQLDHHPNSTSTVEPHSEEQPEDQRRLLKRKLKMLKRLNGKKQVSAAPKSVESNHRHESSSSSVMSEANLSRFSLLAMYANNIKHLNWNFAILNLQSPWDEAKLCLKYDYSQGSSSSHLNDLDQLQHEHK